MLLNNYLEDREITIQCPLCEKPTRVYLEVSHYVGNTIDVYTSCDCEHCGKNLGDID